MNATLTELLEIEDFLYPRRAAGHLKDSVATHDKPEHDKPEGKRSIDAAVKAFNTVTGDGLMNSAERGLMFMAIFKMVQSQQDGNKEYTLEEAIGPSVLSKWAVAVTVDANGAVWEHSTRPHLNDEGSEWLKRKGAFRQINKLPPPQNFKNLIWRVNND